MLYYPLVENDTTGKVPNGQNSIDNRKGIYMPREQFTLNQHPIPDGTVLISKVYGETMDGKGRRVAAIVRDSKVRVTKDHYVTSLPGLATAVARLLGTGDPKKIEIDPVTNKPNARNQSGTGFFCPIDTPENAAWRKGMTFPKAMIEGTEGVGLPDGLSFGSDTDIIIWEDESVTPRGKAAVMPATLAENDTAIKAENERHARRIAALTANAARLTTPAAPAAPEGTKVAPAAPAPVTTGSGDGKGGKGNGKGGKK